MRKLNLFFFLFSLPAFFISSCTKTNTINNSQVIQTPYSLYFTDTAGALFNTTDGTSTNVVMSPDGVPTRCIFSMNKSLLTTKTSMYVSTNNGKNFNFSYPSNYLSTFPQLNVKGKPFDLNQTMAIFVPSWNHAYVSSREPSFSNYFGIAYNESDGALGYWIQDQYYDSPQVTHVGTMHMTTFTLLANGTLVALDGNTRMGMFRKSLAEKWKEMYDPTGNVPLGLPAAPSFYSLGHINNRIIAYDNYGTNGALYSDDLGTTWNAYAGLPANTPLRCSDAPFEQTLLIGTDSMGLYKLNANTNVFEQVGGGLPVNLIVNGIASKENIYKSGTRRQYIYLATNQGIYQSSDLGANWTRTIPGNFVNIY